MSVLPNIFTNISPETISISDIHKYRVSEYECDMDRFLKTATIFNWLQDSMDVYSHNHHIGSDFCQKHGVTFILKNYDVVINQLPKWGDSVEMYTLLSDFSQTSLFFKQFLVRTSTKDVLFNSASQLVLLNLLNGGQPIRLKDCLNPEELASIHIPLTFSRLPNLEQYHLSRQQDIFYDHIDFNQHVNNTHYVSFAERSLSNEFLKKARLQRIRIAYKQAAILGDKLQIQTKIMPGFTDHQIVSDPDSLKPGEQQKQFARLRFSWIRKQND